MRYNKKRKYRIFGDGCNSLPAVIVTDYLAGWWVIELEQFSNMLQVIETVSDEAAIYERTNLVT